MSVRARFQPT